MYTTVWSLLVEEITVVQGYYLCTVVQCYYICTKYTTKDHNLTTADIAFVFNIIRIKHEIFVLKGHLHKELFCFSVFQKNWPLGLCHDVLDKTSNRFELPLLQIQIPSYRFRYHPKGLDTILQVQILQGHTGFENLCYMFK